MKSMTGYGAAEARTQEAEIAVVVKSVNGRFLETRFHLPKEYFAFESQLKKIISQNFRRGTIDVFVHRRGRGQYKVEINKMVAARWAEAYRDLAKTLKAPVSNEKLVERLTHLPQVFEVRDRLQVSKIEQKALLGSFTRAVVQCQKERVREGLSLRNHLEKRIRSLVELVKKMSKHRNQANTALEARFKDRLRKLGLENSLDPVRLAQEIVVQLDKCDISEELERLNEHLHTCEKYLKLPEEQGKKLDFYSQELLREVNTVGSKANYAPITEHVVQAKGLIEAFKEQVQNIE